MKKHGGDDHDDQRRSRPPPEMVETGKDSWYGGFRLERLEVDMLRAAVSGELLEPSDNTSDPASATIRAAVLCHLLVDTKLEVPTKKVWLRGLRISGRLDLQGASVCCPLRLEDCNLEDCESVDLDYATAPMLALIRCRLPKLSGKALTVRSDLDLTGSTLSGSLLLQGADITGDLNCISIRLEGTGDALRAAAIKVGGNVYLDHATTTNGGIDLEGADIQGTLKCSSAQLNGAVECYGEKAALFAQWIKVGGPVRLNQNFTAAYQVYLLGADLSANLNCRYGHLNGSGTALQAERMKLGGNLLGDPLYVPAGIINLVGASIGGNLKLTGSELNATPSTLFGERLKVHGDGILNSVSTPHGAIWLPDADFGGNLTLTGTSLNRGEWALYGERLKVHGDAFLNSVSTPYGAIWLPDADITGKLHWAPAEQMHGHVSLAGAKAGLLDDDWTLANGYWPTGGRLHLEGFTYGAIAGDHPASVDERLGWIRSEWPQYSPKPPKSPWTDMLSYPGPTSRSRKAKTQDSPKSPWTDTLSYAGAMSVLRHTKMPQAITMPSPGMPTPTDSTARFATQPYEQLAGVYQQVGQDNEARKVAIARRRDMRRYGNLTWYRRALNWLLDITIQYGYQTWRAVLGLAVVYAAAVVVFWMAQHQANLIVPLMQTASGHQPPPVTQCTSHYPCFYPAGYAIDTVIPIINVHQSTYWGPNGHAPLGHALTVFTWLCTILGWTLATLVAAGYTGLVRNTDAV